MLPLYALDHLHVFVGVSVWHDYTAAGCDRVQGMLRSRGRRLLFADADGATRFTDIEKLESELAKLELTSPVTWLHS